ncbi:uncharacterized protein PV09_03462 [Verruconis gallopava]|uniref:Uncharacterized protein n=1 Tax=Verruconis gallopava TaxID=253628 RepID=A0A0D1YY40_9PEZI|nr:uncharacterized protein PV09_03462 [Verruconis gallopava]KIW05587.1 hypothetical protein PV09_03462 [Verruconis gallopava]
MEGRSKDRTESSEDGSARKRSGSRISRLLASQLEGEGQIGALLESCTRWGARIYFAATKATGQDRTGQDRTVPYVGAERGEEDAKTLKKSRAKVQSNDSGADVQLSRFAVAAVRFCLRAREPGAFRLLASPGAIAFSSARAVQQRACGRRSSAQHRRSSLQHRPRTLCWWDTALPGET